MDSVMQKVIGSIFLIAVFSWICYDNVKAYQFKKETYTGIVTGKGQNNKGFYYVSIPGNTFWLGESAYLYNSIQKGDSLIKRSGYVEPILYKKQNHAWF